jgi:PelA/Pel-15E family pectate lyase
MKIKYLHGLIFVLAWIGNLSCVNSQSLAPSQGNVQQDVTAENMLLWQRNNGGWPKDTYPVFIDDARRANNPEPPVPTKKVIDYAAQTEEQKKLALATKHFEDATIDNNHTVKEIKYLLKAFKDTGNQAYLDAADKGVRYLLEAQYENGGWPQFYPDKRLYKHQITFNDNAMANVLDLMLDITEGIHYTKALDKQWIDKSDIAFKKGIEIILKTQIVSHGKKTVWCAQYDEVTLVPAKARNYELPSFSGLESVGIVKVLMRIKNPSNEIIESINSAIAWLDEARIDGIKTQVVRDASQPSGKDVVVVQAANSVMWARFYDLETGRPFFCDRDGIKKNTLAEIGNERRTGYAWYGDWPRELLEKDYPAWKQSLN